MIRLAKSMAGHDRGRIFVIVKEETEYVFLADGKLRLLENPKKKKRKHIQLIEKLPRETEEILAAEPLRDLDIKRALKLYGRNLKQEDSACQKQM